MPKGWQGLVAGRKRALITVALAAVAGVLAPAARVRAAPSEDAFDDPKLARELPAAPPPHAPIASVAAPAPVAKPNVTVAVAPAASPSIGQPPAKTSPPVKGASVPPALVPPPPVAAEPASASPPAAVLPAMTMPAPLAAPIAVPATTIPPPPPVPVVVPVPAPAAPEAAVPPAAAASPAAPAAGRADLTVKARPPEPAPVAAAGPWPYHPRLKLGYRWFSFSRMPPSGSTAAVASETFQSLSLDVYPTSSYLRVGLSSQFGWESGQFQRTGDYFVAESMTTGFQIPGRFTPFLEGLAGAGYMRRLQAGSSSPTAYWQLGVDGGVEVYVAKRAYVSVAVGYLHPGNLFVQQKNLSGINTDTWSLKVGLGI